MGSRREYRDNRDNMKRIFVGNLPTDVRHGDLEDLFHKFGKINFIDLKTRRGPPFAFVEFTDYRDAEEAVRARHGKKYEGQVLRVEFPRGKERTSKFRNGSGTRSSAPQRRSKYRVIVKGLPASGSWQDLKDHMREIGEVCYADVYRGGEGVVEFLNYDDMRYAIKKLDNTKFKSHEGDSAYITLREDSGRGGRGDSRSRSRSPVSKRRGSPPYSTSSKRRASRSPSRSRSRSRSPPPKSRSRRGRSESRSVSRSRSKSRSRSVTPSKSRSVSRSRSKSGSRSASPRSERASSRGSPAHSRSKSKSGSRSRSVTPRSGRGSSRASPARARSGSRSPSRSISRSPHDETNNHHDDATNDDDRKSSSPRRSEQDTNDHDGDRS